MSIQFLKNFYWSIVDSHVVLVSAVQQSESVIHYIYPLPLGPPSHPPPPSHPSRSSQSTELSFPCFTASLSTGRMTENVKIWFACLRTHPRIESLPRPTSLQLHVSRVSLPRPCAPHVSTEHLKYDSSRLRCATRVKYTPNFEDLV